MKKQLHAVALSCFLILSGCAAEKTTFERGWIGGHYLESDTSLLKRISRDYFQDQGEVVPILPKKIKERQSGAILVSRVFADTPVMQAGIREGDLIFAVDGETVEDLPAFRRLVDGKSAGDRLLVSVYRGGEIVELPVTVGRETYQKWGYFHLGFRLGTEFNVLPTPYFNLLSLVSYEKNDRRLQLQSPEYRYYRDSLALSPGDTDRKPESEVDAEGWDAWFVLFGFSGKNIILTQET